MYKVKIHPKLCSQNKHFIKQLDDGDIIEISDGTYVQHQYHGCIEVIESHKGVLCINIYEHKPAKKKKEVEDEIKSSEHKINRITNWRA
jgi:hypothetical protein